MSRLRFVLAMAWREGRASRRRGLLLIAAVAIGVAALVAINSFTDNLGDSVRTEARALLGADLVVSSYQAFSDDTEAVLEELRVAAAPPDGAAVAVARTITFGAMARVPDGGATRLVQVRAVDPGLPVLRHHRDPSRRRVGSPRRRRGEARGRPLAAHRPGDRGRRPVRPRRGHLHPPRAIVENFPGDVGVRSSLGPRVFIGPTPGGGHRPARLRGPCRPPRLPGDPPGGRPPEAVRRASGRRFGAQRVNLRTVEQDQQRLGNAMSRLGNYLGLVALVALLLGGLGVASAVHVFIKRRMESVAVLRCLGAGAGTVLAVYLVQAVTVGLLGSLAGAGLGAVIQLALPRVLRDILPVDVAWSPSWPPLLGGVGVGVWVALVFSVLPLLAIRRVSPLMVLRRDYEGERPRRDPARLGGGPRPGRQRRRARRAPGRRRAAPGWASPPGWGWRSWPCGSPPGSWSAACAATSPPGSPTSTARDSPTSTARRTRR